VSNTVGTRALYSNSSLTSWNFKSQCRYHTLLKNATHNPNKILTTRSNNVHIFKEMSNLATWHSLNDQNSSRKITLNVSPSKQASCVWLSCLQSMEWRTHSAQSVLRQTVFRLCQYWNNVFCLKKNPRETASSVFHQQINWMLYMTN